MVQSIIYEYDNNSLRILNQLLLPVSVEYETINSAEDAWNAIKLMKVRGAPAIAILGLLSVAVELGQEAHVRPLNEEPSQLLNFLTTKVCACESL